MPKRIALFFVLLVSFAVQAQTANSRTVTIAWSSVATATGYNVYKAQSPCAGATFSKITAAPITPTTFSETGLADGVTRCYYVTAVNGAGESTPSGTVQLTTPTYTAPVAAVIPPPATITASSQ